MGKSDKANAKERVEKKEKTKKNKKLEEADEGTVEATPHAERRAAGSSRILAEDNNTADESRKAKKKRKAVEDVVDDSEPAVVLPVSSAEDEEEPKRTRKKKKGKERNDGSTAASAIEDDVKPKKSKKRHSNQDEEIAGAAQEKDGSRKRKKRRKESKSGFLDPETDDTLSDQAKKALSYAYLQAEEPSSWKFNKARQNWLLRNVWSDETIPDTHVSLANRYLAGVQGGVRETLLKTCREIIAAKVVEEVKPAEPETEGDQTKKSVKFDVPEAKENSDAAATTLAMKQKRAQGLLDVLLPS